MSGIEIARTLLMLGFDARPMRADLCEAWPLDRRSQCLIRIDIGHPLSVDSEVWPSVFDVHPELSRPGWRGPVQELWDDLKRLEAHIDNARRSVALPLWVIAVGVIPNSGGRDGVSRWRNRTGEIRPDSVQPAWAFLGFDVADEWLESGLTNRVFRPDVEDPEMLRGRWAPCLNEYHLFPLFEAAEEFVKFSDARSPEHAPFYVYGLWRVSELPPIILPSDEMHTPRSGDSGITGVTRRWWRSES
jgi:hypothetical protein